MDAGHALRTHLSTLTRFSGRETRSEFWPYVGIVFSAFALITFAQVGSALLGGISKIERFAKEHPDQAQVQKGPGERSVTVTGDHPELMPDLGVLNVAMPVVILITVALLASAVARRLHDLGRSGRWGALPLPFLLAGCIAMPLILSKPAFHSGLFTLMLFNNMIYLATVVRLLLWLAKPGSEEPNQYGARVPWWNG